MNNVVKQIAILTGLAIVLLVGNQYAMATAPEVNIAQGPLFSGRGNVHPNMLLNLSVEFPTVGAAYRGTNDYNRTTEYLGYFNPKKCYTYPTTTTSNTTTGTTSGTTINNSTSTANATTTTTTTSGITTTVTTTTDVVTTVPGTSAVYAKVLAGTGKGIYPNFTSGGIEVYTTINTSTGVLSGFVGYISGSKTGRGTRIRDTNGTDATGSTLVSAATTTSYNHTPSTSTATTTAIPYPDLTDAAGYFSIFKAADATTHECGGDSFSGNFMNWASSSAIDMLRYAMTGGDRTTDTATLTVLQRAYLRDVGGTFYASSTYFPRRTVTATTTMSAPNQVTPFNTTTLYVVSCRNRILFSNTNGGGDCDTARTSGSPAALLTTDKYFGEYLARVKVCDSEEGPTRTDLCQKYGSNYKPEGDLQRNSDKIRVGALGYLTEHDTSASNLYGGVVRGPVKYVGPKKFESPSFSESANDKLEWDATTGVFYNNPENSADRTGTTNSGVINYLNKFGRTNPSRLGAYKGYDPIGEMYYEAMRYLQGQQPTSGTTNATSAIFSLGSDTTDDNFPVQKTWVDPVTASCQSNYIVTIGDVNTHYDRYIPGNTRTDYLDATRAADVATSTLPALDVMTWSKKVGDREADASSTYGNSAPRTGLANLDTLNTGSGSHGTYYMAGLAYWANTSDIRLDKPVRVKSFSIDVDEGGNGSIEDTNPRGTKPRNSQLYLAAKYGGFLDKNKDGNPFKTFADDGVTVVNNNNEWSSNGTDPDNYFLASDPTKMINSIHSIFQSVASNSGTISGVTLTSTKISTDSSYVYQPGFDPSKWSGNLLKLELKLVDQGVGDKTAADYVPNMVVTIQDAKTPTWDAGIVLTGKAATTTPVAAAVPANPAPASRAIYTAQVNADKSLTTIPFQWTSLTADQQLLLDQSPVSPFAADGLGEKRVNYLRGSRADEIGQTNGVFRQRDKVLGDIINSNPTYVGAPAANIQGDGYKTFYDGHKGRTKAVYVGANDGMLHAFAAADGVELFAYVPNAVIAGLNQLTNPNYVHRPYVDGTMTVMEARVGNSWKTILASGMGGGAQGAFVLDVTDPADFTSGSGAIWEFTDKDDPDMGNLASPPLVAKFKTGVSVAGAPVYKYFVVIPSGLNNYKDDGASNFGTTEPAVGALFLLSLDKNPGDAWALGSNYYKFKTPVKDVTLQNGLSSPALVVGNDGAVRYAYAGDLQGNMWRFDFTGAAPWSGARASSTPLFTAKDDDNNRQPITEQPKVVFAPGGGYVVLFGTGKYVEDADAAAGNFKTQSFYAVLDTTYNADAVTGRSQLEKRTLTKYTTGGSDAMTFSGNDFTYGVTSDSKKGWYFDFLDSGGVTGTGERSVTNPLVTYGRLFFNSLVTGSDPCSTGGGRTYGLDVLTGLPVGGTVSGDTSTVGMPSSPVPVETGTTVGDRDSIGKRVVNKKVTVINSGTGGKAGTVAAASNGSFTLTPPAGRSSWREILNWQELRDAAKSE